MKLLLKILVAVFLLLAAIISFVALRLHGAAEEKKNADRTAPARAAKLEKLRVAKEELLNEEKKNEIENSSATTEGMEA